MVFSGGVWLVGDVDVDVGFLTCYGWMVIVSWILSRC